MRSTTLPGMLGVCDRALSKANAQLRCDCAARHRAVNAGEDVANELAQKALGGTLEDVILRAGKVGDRDHPAGPRCFQPEGWSR